MAIDSSWIILLESIRSPSSQAVACTSHIPSGSESPPEEIGSVELVRIQAEEEKRQAAMDLEVELWTASNNILSFLEACEQTIKERFGPIEPDSREARWLCCARTYANRLNPLMNGRLERAIKSLRESTTVILPARQKFQSDGYTSPHGPICSS